MSGILSYRITDTPVAVIDFETTGLTPGYDRAVEVAVVRIEPGEAPRLVFDTLVNPERPMAATEIHGITDDDVANAPRFRDIAGDLLESVKGCVIAAYNVYFDMKFLKAELDANGVRHLPPHICLMYMRPMLDLGRRCRLAEACDSHGIAYDETHMAADDALAAAKLYRTYLPMLHQRRVNTFRELADLRSYKFNDSFECTPFPAAAEFGLKCREKVHSRSGFAVPVNPVRKAMADYWEALKTVVEDLEVTDDELEYVLEERRRGGLHEEQIRVLHARAFQCVISQFTSDQWLDDREVRKLRRLNQCLAKLGWAPGH